MGLARDILFIIVLIATLTLYFVFEEEHKKTLAHSVISAILGVIVGFIIGTV